VIRFAMLRSHYRSITDYSEDALHAARSGYERIKTAYEALKIREASDGEGQGVLKWAQKIEDARKRFMEAMDDDFNTPAALAAAFDLTAEVNVALASAEGFGAKDWSLARGFYDELVCDVLGVDLSEKGVLGESIEGKLIDLLIGLRRNMRDHKLWEQADHIRDGLLDLGIQLKDTPDGTTWKRS
jgi:cysteinyl-tRNA synthetase